MDPLVRHEASHAHGRLEDNKVSPHLAVERPARARDSPPPQLVVEESEDVCEVECCSDTREPL